MTRRDVRWNLEGKRSGLTRRIMLQCWSSASRRHLQLPRGEEYSFVFLMKPEPVCKRCYKANVFLSGLEGDKVYIKIESREQRLFDDI